jgi:hypothetical protein
MQYELVTAGERLAYFVETRILTRTRWDELSVSLLYTGRGEELSRFFREICIIHLTCRIVTAGTSLLKDLPDRPARVASDPSFERDLRVFIRERLNIFPPLQDGLLRAAVAAVRVTQQDISQSDRKALKHWAERSHRTCYMCGISLDFTEQDRHLKFSAEHIWPQRYGGDSVEDNLLPACGACNAGRKRDFASWAMAGVQSMILGFMPSENEYRSVEGIHKFAMHYLAAKNYAIERKTTLKQAFRDISSWEDMRLSDEGDIGDFFNLENHRASIWI